MKNRMMSLPKIGVPVALVGMAIAAFVLVTRWNLDPQVILAKADYAANSVGSISAKKELLTQMPQVLNSATWFTLSVLGGLGAFALIFSFAYSLVLHNTSRFLSGGLEYTKNENGAVTTVKLIQPNAQRLPMGNRGAADPRVMMDRPQLGGKHNNHALPTGKNLNANNPNGRKLEPWERQAPGKQMDRPVNPFERNAQLGSGGKPKVPSQTDPLVEMEEVLGR